MQIDKHHFYADPNRPTPLYYQIQENLVELITLELLKPGDMLPSERELCRLYGVSRLTVRQAIEPLVMRGLLKRQHGVGTFVAEQPRTGSFAPTVMGFSQRMREAGAKPSSRLLEKAIVTAPPLVYHRLDLRADAQVVRLRRVRLVDDEPLMVETSYLPLARFPGLLEQDLGSQSLYRVLETAYNTAIAEADQTLEPTVLNEHEAELLGVAAGMPAMLVQIIAYTGDHQPVEFSKSVVRGDRCRFYFRVQTAQPIVR